MADEKKNICSKYDSGDYVSYCCEGVGNDIQRQVYCEYFEVSTSHHSIICAHNSGWCCNSLKAQRDLDFLIILEEL